MNNKDSDFVMAFDHFYTTNHIQILKSLLPFLGSDLAPMLPVFVKYLELKHTIECMNQKKVMSIPCENRHTPITSFDKITPALLEEIYQAVHCYVTPEEDKKLQNIRNILQAFNSFQEMQQIMELMKAFSPDENSTNQNGMDFASMDLQTMLSGMMNQSSSADLMSMLSNLNL